MISIKNVSKHYGTFQVLTDCTTSVSKGEVIVVCGPSGSGKSTLIKCVNGLEPFQSGEIIVDGISVGDPATNLSKLRSRVGMVFQNFELFPHMSIIENLSVAQVKVLGRGVDEAKEKGIKLLDRVGLRVQAEKFPGQLSELAQEGMTMMCVTHEMGFAKRVANRVIFMDQGKIVEDASKEAFFEHARSERAQQFLAKILHH
jgi:glutamate/aspartate transport system ATP-binding protein